MTRTVLLIDDEPDIRRIAEVTLQLTMGWTVLTAPSGREGIRLAASHRPDLVLLDAVMPDMDGQATLQALRERAETRTIPVVFLTARSAEAGSAVALGARGMIAKPFNPVTLGSEIAAIVGWSHGS